LIKSSENDAFSSHYVLLVFKQIFSCELQIISPELVNKQIVWLKNNTSSRRYYEFSIRLYAKCRP